MKPVNHLATQLFLAYIEHQHLDSPDDIKHAVDECLEAANKLLGTEDVKPSKKSNGSHINLSDDYMSRPITGLHDEECRCTPEEVEEQAPLRAFLEAIIQDMRKNGS